MAATNRQARDSRGYTRTQARIMDLLEDGTWRRRQELLDAIDEMADSSNLAMHMYRLRQVIAPQGLLIVRQVSSQYGVMYRLCRTLMPMSNG